MNNYKYFLIIFLTFFPKLCLSDPVGDTDKRGFSMWEKQMIHAGNSLFAAHSPEGYGMLMIALSPLSFGPSDSEYEENLNYMSFGGFFSIGLYNVTELRKDKYSKSGIFIRNFILSNIFTGWMDSLEAHKKIPSGLSLTPYDEGFKLSYDIRF